MRIKALHVISGISQQSGGPARSSQGLVAAERAAGVDALIYTFDRAVPWIDGVVALKTSGEKLSAGEARQFELVHIHGIWSPRLHDICVICRAAGVPYVIAPRGMLEPWSLNAKKWKKRLAMRLYQRRDLACAVALHATAESEAVQFRKLGFKQPILISPNGVDLPVMMPPRATREDGKKTILFLSRIHPKKGLMELVEAWAKVRRSALVHECVSALITDGQKSGDRGQETKQRQSAVAVGSSNQGPRKNTNELMNSRTNELTAWHVEYAGPDYGGHLHEVQKRIKELGVEDDFTYLGDLSDVEKWHAYRRADVFVLPTYSENFGIVVAESLAAGIPVITTKGTPWQELEGSSCHSSLVNECVSSLVGNDQKSEIGSQKSEVLCTNVRKNLRTNDLARTGRAGWWIDVGVEPLAEALRDAMGLSDEARHAMGENGRKLVEAKYTWPAIAEQMKAAYAWILNGGELPPSVMLE